MKNWLLTFAAIGSISLAVGGFALAGSSPPTGGRDFRLGTISNHGTSLPLSPSSRVLVQSFNARAGFALSETYLLGVRGERAFFRLTGGTRTCFAGGTATFAGAELYSVSCAESFPSSQPVLNFSIVEATQSRPTPAFINLRGVAADAVATVAATNQQGDVVAKTAVVNNIFHLAKLPSGVEATGFVAFNSAGEVLYQTSTLRGGS